MLSLSCRSGASLAKYARNIHLSRAAIAAPTQLQAQQQAHRIARQEIREHYERIAATTRPISPHLMIYRMESHMFSSLMNRATGCYMACGLIGFGGISLIWGDWFNQASLLLSSVHPLFTTFIKFCLAYPLGLHVANGLRHLAHDCGYLLNSKHYTATSIVTLSFALAFGCAWALYIIK